MLILHAGFHARSLLLWAETPPQSAPPRRRRGSIPLHPYGASELALDEALGHLEIARSGRTTAIAHLPSIAGLPQPSHPLIAEPPDSSEEPSLAPWKVSALDLSAEAMIALLSACAQLDGARTLLAPGILIGKDLAFWAIAMRFGLSLLERAHFLPGAGEDEHGFYASWEPVFVGKDAERFSRLAAAMPEACRALTLTGEQPTVPRRLVLKGFLDDLVDHLARPGKRPVKQRPYDTPHDAWVEALGSTDGDLAGEATELKNFVAQVSEWRRPLDVQAPYRLCFRLDEPETDDTWRLEYLLQAVDDPSLLIPGRAAFDPEGGQAALLRRGGKPPREYLLAALGQASGLCPEVVQSLKAAVPAGGELDATGAYRFLSERAPLLEEAGFGLLLPAWWSGKGTRQRLGARVQVKSPEMKASSGLSLDTVVQFDYELALGGETLGLEELQALAKLKAPLVKVRGQWMEVDSRAIRTALDFLKQRATSEGSARDAIRLALGMTRGPDGLEVEHVAATGWIAELLDQLEGKSAFETEQPPHGLQATLRPYQIRGYSWLRFLTRWGLGACLADDMGLGKTIQLLSLVQSDVAAGNHGPTLLVAPTSVVGNWQREAARFTPGLAVFVHHGAGRIKGAAFREQVEGKALVVTSYALLQRDMALLSGVAWRGLVLDEAQNIKNPEAKQSKAARALSADYRVALTGTPVENHLGDLWSLMEFLNPGFLGSQAAFRREFFLPIQTSGDPEATERLKRLTSPFLLRRLKTDKAILADLPEKQEMTVFCPLTREQASLYAAVVEEASEALESAEGIRRKGVVLATLSKLKQVCNHPAQFLGDRSALANRSGKLARLTEMLEEIRSVGDRALVFTQFAEMGALLRTHLQETFGEEVYFLHGGVPKAQRDRMVERFQEDPAAPRVFVLSLKAGGTGLNLTRANHVFHFDRWWNPAVENQASDRAFRIGQRKDVQVHKFLCQGTLEEKIGQMIERKKALAEQVVGTGEDWLTKLSTSELKELFALRRDALEV